jgi:CubicO group peptidase (beta-lactamase class C family)
VIYSITKSVISAAFLLLAVEGEVALDASAGSLPGDGRFAVSVRQLLQHTSGIRREEAAQLAFISTEYYTRLEQARGPRPSREVLAGLAGLAGLADEDSAAVLGISRQRVNQLRNT